MKSNLTSRYIVIICSLLLLRLYTLQFPALLDPTEARYATIAQRMVETGQYMIPEVNRGDGFIPFWGKPPLHFWLTALSFKAFGFNEFAARFPSFLCLIGVAALISYFAFRIFEGPAAYIAPLILFSAPLFTFLFCTCIVDTTLTLFITGAMVSFALFLFEDEGKAKNNWSHLFFVCLALGFLTKGPLCLALVGGSIFFWCLSQRSFVPLFKLPLIRGSIIFFTLAAPWFVYAEFLSPGFLNYFFVHENFLRFITPNYGDIYGSSHPSFRGVTALLLLASFLPWTVLPLFAFKTTLGRIDENSKKWGAYTLSWGLTPALFFMPSNNVIITYLLPGIPGLALVASLICIKNEVVYGRFARCIIKPLVSGLTIACAYMMFHEYFRSVPMVLLLGGLITLTTILFFNFRSSQITLLGKMSSHTAIIYFLGIFGLIVLSPYVSDAMSTKMILSKRRDSGETGSVIFVGKLPYSAQFYRKSIGGDDTMPMLIESAVDAQGKDIIVTRKSSAALLQDRDASISTKHWVLIDRDEESTNDQKK